MTVNKDDGSFSERVSSSYRQLSLAASHLNLVSDELGKSIVVLDAAQSPDTLETWRRRQMDLSGEFGHRHPAICLQQGKQSAVGTIQRLGHGVFQLIFTVIIFNQR